LVSTKIRSVIGDESDHSRDVADGMFRPDEDRHLPANARVRLTVEPLETMGEDQREALRELESFGIGSGPPPLSRDQLHDRD
jgi:hypothetical protein